MSITEPRRPAIPSPWEESLENQIAALEKRIVLLERYASSIAMWMERENVTDQERLSYIKGHPITRAAADRSKK